MVDRQLAQHKHYGGNVLLGLTCVSASECWGVGYYYGLATSFLRP